MSIFGPGRFVNDDGTEINPHLVPKPSLCILCKMDDDPDEEEEVMCILNRADQMDKDEFICYGFIKK